MRNKSLIEQQELIRYPRIIGEDYSVLHCTICYKRVGDDAWMLNSDNLPEAIQVQAGGAMAAHWLMNREQFVKWWHEIVSFEQSDRDIGDCEGSTLLQKIQNWFEKINAEVRVEEICN